ncbi:MAG TPA: BON domain-containing protein [Vicinamibacterales bacterium]|nr:BON domain-containing protein [Vicinamibacterales bacterium]
MTTATLTATDVRLRDTVIRELDWDPEVDDSAIGVTAKDGVVTLTGFIDSYAGKLSAEQVTKRVRGVRAVANDIIVHLKVDVTDSDIAAAAALALKLRSGIPPNVQLTVHDGHVTLTGHVDWLHQKEIAEVAVRHVGGVRGVLNRIDVTPRTAQRDVRHRIVQSLHRNADLDARHIDVAVTDDVVTLTGTVGSWSQRDAAERGAGSAPGIRQVANQIRVVPPEPHAFEPPDEIC